MKIAVLSGKGGTGKTTVSTNLFNVLKNATLIDTDVEEPNSYLYLNPKFIEEQNVYKHFPVIDSTNCTLCGDCGDFCKFNALLPAIKKVHVFEDLCHDCGGCSLVCKTNAISFDKKVIGKIHHGISNNKKILYGDLNIGELSGVKIIEKLKELTSNDDLVIIDSPPGTSCSTVSSIEDVDYAILVTEPTPFGLSDMLMVVELLNKMNISFGVVINKAGLGNKDVYQYLKDKKIKLLAEIPFDKKYAYKSASGILLSNEYSEFKEYIKKIARNVLGDNYEN